jgi:hypothetical protein
VLDAERGERGRSWAGGLGQAAGAGGDAVAVVLNRGGLRVIHDEMGRAFVLGADGPEGIELRTPLDALLSSEVGDLSREDVMVAGVEAVRALHAWICDQGAHPRRVAERLVKATQHYAPDLAARLLGVEVVAVIAAPAAREAAMMRVLLGSPKAPVASVRAHAARISAVLGRAYRRERHTWQAARPGLRLEVLLVEDELAGPEEEQVRRAMVRRWLRQVWAPGAGLADALKAFYALTRACWPELILNMSGEEVAAFFAQTRAAESERVHRLVNRPIERHTGRHTTLRFQKSTAACGKYAGAAKGNTHRADAARRAA